MLDTDTDELVTLATRGFGQRTMDYFHRVDASSNTSCGLALRTGKQAYFNFDPDSRDHAVRLHVEDGVLSAQSWPLVSRSGKPIGMVSTHWGEAGHRPSERELRFLDLLARQAADLLEQRAAAAALRKSEERQAFLLKLADALRPLADPVEVQTEAARVLGEHLGAGRASYAEIDADGAHVTVHRDYTDGVPSFAGRYVFASFGSALVAVLRAGRAVTVADAERDTRLSEAARAAYAAGMVRSAIGVPLVKGGRLAAPYFVHSPAPREGTADEVALVEETAERAWAAVERAKAEAALRESEAALAADLANAELLRSLAERLVTEENAGTIYDEILSAAVDVARSDAGTMQIYDPQTRSLEIIASRNFSRTITDYFHHVDAGSRTACGIALNTGHRAFVDFPDEVADPGCLLLVDEGLQSALALPLVSRSGTPLGMLNTHWRETGHRPTEKQLRFLDLIARQAADLIEQRQAQSVLDRKSTRLNSSHANISYAVFC